MKKFILIHSKEGDLSIKGVCDMLVDAQDIMKEEFKSYFIDNCKWSEEEYREVLKIQAQDDGTGSCFLGERYAWSRYKVNLDWKIEEVEI